MTPTKEWLKTNYDIFNRKYFENSLPEIVLKISHGEKRFGFAGFSINRYNDTMYNLHISISDYYDSPETNLQNTLLHEMIHIYDYVSRPYYWVDRYIRHEAHGKFFKSVAEKIRKDGWIIERCVTNEELKNVKVSEAIIKKHSERYIAFIRPTGEDFWVFCQPSKQLFSKLLNKINCSTYSEYEIYQVPENDGLVRHKNYISKLYVDNSNFHERISNGEGILIRKGVI